MTKIGGGLGQGSIQKKLGPLRIFATVEASNFKFSTQLGFETSLPKRRLGPKLVGVWARGAHTKNWDPLRISASVEASNFKFGTQIWFGISLPKTTFRTKIGRGDLGEGSIRKNVGPPIYFCNR